MIEYVDSVILGERAEVESVASGKPSVELDLRNDSAGTLHVVTGMKGTGRESLLVTLERDLLNSGVAPELVLRVDLLDVRLCRCGGSVLADVVDAYLTRFPEARSSRFYLLVDNVEMAKGWMHFIGYVLNAYDVIAVVTGACESWLTQYKSGAFPPNAQLHWLHPRALSSAVLFDDGDYAIEPPSILSVYESERFSRYLEQGGLNVHGVRKLQQLLSAAIVDDVISRNSTFPHPLCLGCAAAALSSSGKNFSVSSLEAEMRAGGFSSTRATLTRMLLALQEAQIISLSGEFRHANERNARMSQVVYAGDHGLAAACSAGGALEPIAAMRTVAYNELRRRNMRDVYYFRTSARHNVHFAWGDAEEGRVEGMMHVTTAAMGSRRFERSAGILAAGMAEANVQRATLLAAPDTPAKTITLRGKIIDVVPAWKWLVEG